jgi:hypothetical protein
LYEDEAIREFHFIINGKDMPTGAKNLRFIAHRCYPDPCFEGAQVVKKETEKGVRLWSNPESWTSGEVPVEGESFIIESGWNMQLDLPETPIFDQIEINGLLKFKPDMDVHLRA